MESIREGAAVSFIILRLDWRTQLAPEVSRDSSAFPWPGHGPAAGQLDRNRQGLGLLGEDEHRRRQRAGRYRQALAENRRGVNPAACGNENRNTGCCQIDSHLLSREGREKGEKQTAVSFPWEGEKSLFSESMQGEEEKQEGFL